MSSSIDNRIVKLGFDNQQFEQGVKTSLQTLTSLDNKLNTPSNSSGYLSSIATSLEALNDRFSTLGIIGINVVSRITNAFIDGLIPVITTVKGTIDSMSVNFQNLAASFGKYEEMIVNQQTIMSSVQGKINNLTKEAYNMSDVSSIIDRLRWYTDETSYNLDQMVNAIGNFTASGIDLNKSEAMILGIANACADAGIGAAKADIAMTGFSKAIGAGQLTLSVWNNQLKTSGITNSERFRQSLLDAAVAEGTLVEVNGKLMTSNMKEEVTLSNLTESLTEYGWANNAVMERVLNSYASTVNGVYSLTQDGKLDLASSAFDDLRKAMERQGKTLDDLGLNEQYDQASEAIAALTNAYKELGLEVPKSLSAFTRAQEAVSWTQAIEATGTAVRSQWAKTFELIFGNYEEAKRLWTGVANSMWGIFAGGGDTRNEIFELWHDNSYEAFSEGIINAFVGIENAMYGFRSLFQSIFAVDAPSFVEQTAEAFSNLTDSFSERMLKFSNLTSRFSLLAENLDILRFLKPISEININSIRRIEDLFDPNKLLPLESVERLKSLVSEFGNLEKVLDGFTIVSNLQKTFKGFISILDIGRQIVDGFWRATEPLREVLGRLALNLLNVSGSIGEWITNLSQATKENDIFYKVFKTLVDIIMGFGVPAFETITKLVKNLNDRIKPLKDLFVNTKEALSDFFNQLKNSIGLKDSVNSFEKMGAIVRNLSSWIWEAAKNIANAFITIFNSLNFKQVGDAINTGLISGIFYKIFDMFKGNKTSGVLDFITGFKEVLTQISGTLKEFQNSLKADQILKLAEAIGILALSLAVLAAIDSEGLGQAVVAMGLLFTELALAYKYLSGLNTIGDEKTGLLGMLFGKSSKSINTTVLISLASAVLILSGAMAILASIDDQGAVRGIFAIGALLTEIAVFSKYAKKIKAKHFVSLSSAILILSGAIKLLSTIDDEAVLKGVVTIGALLTEFGFFYGAMEKWGGSSVQILAAAASMTIMATAMLEFVGVLALLSLMDQTKIAAGLITIGVALLEFAIAANAMKGTLGAAASILVISTALLALAPALMMLGSMSLWDIIKALLAMAGAFAVFFAAGVALGPMVPVLLSLAAAVALFGAGLIGVAASVGIFAAGLTALAAAISTSGILIATALDTIIVQLLTTIGNAIVAFVTTIASSAGAIIEAAKTLIIAFCTAIIESIDVIVQAGVTIIAAVLNGINDNIFEFTVVAFSIIIKLIDGLVQKLPELIQAGVDLIIAFIDGMAKAIDENSERLTGAVSRLMKSIVIFAITALQELAGLIPFFGDDIKMGLEEAKTNIRNSMKYEDMKTIAKDGGRGLTDGVKAEKGPLKTEAKAFADIPLTELKNKNFESESKKYGKYIPSGLASGINSNSSTAISAASGVASRALAAAKSALGIASPSKEFAKIGQYSDEGLAQGFWKYSGLVQDASEAIAKSTLQAFTDPLSNIADIVSGEIDLDPTIRPVLDLTDVEQKSGYLDKLLDTSTNIGLKDVSAIAATEHDKTYQNYSPNISVVINATENQSVDELYEVFNSRINADIKRRMTVWQ